MVPNQWGCVLRHHPHYPLVRAGEDSVLPPPEDAQVQALLKSLPEDQVYALILLTYVGRGDFSADDLPSAYQTIKETFPSKDLINRCLGLANVRIFWGWRNCTSTPAEGIFDAALDLRHEIAHGVNPRPVIHNTYSKRLPGFIRRLARCTDDAVRNHLTTTLGLANPWPP